MNAEWSILRIYSTEHSLTTMSPEILTQAVRLTSGLTELSFVFSIWIVSLPAYPEHRPQGAFSRQTRVATLYAISEPIHTRLLLRITLAPPILVLGTSIIHLTTSILFTDSLKAVLAKSNHTPDSSGNVSHIEKLQPEQPLGSESANKTRAEYHCIRSAFEYVFTQTSAASNASFLLLAQYLLVANKDNSSTPMWLSAFGFAFFMISRMADYSMASVTQRPLFLGQRGLTADTSRQVQLLIFYLVVRTMVRLALGMGPLSMFEKAAVIENMFRPGRDAWWQDFAWKLPAWLPFALSALSVGLTGLSQWCWARVQRRAREMGE
jgi:hypothetical protein